MLIGCFILQEQILVSIIEFSSVLLKINYFFFSEYFTLYCF